MQSAIITAARKFDNAIRKTVLDEAINVANAVTGEWEVMDAETASSIAKEITTDYPQGSRGARTSEWKAFIMAAHHNLAAAIRYAKKEMPNFARIDLFKLCRMLPSANSYKAAVDTLKKDKAAKKKGSTKPRTFSSVLKGMKDATQPGLSKTKQAEFRRKLSELCKEFGVAY